ncbi:cytochrome P450, putative (Eurofung) [Sclerotinia borealis F-4128]|uniref:TPA: cytochrome P450, putative (Eurofung) n=1 Tax=Sclerotinia borealis (strain F-4128) TaxID=1432307 RepID=W9C4Y1_SCLBF|nr:cytochrome P450, putative (Eurofung) [Sclerotinia borealis F-4128]
MRGEESASTINDRDLLSRFLAAQVQNPGTPPFALFSWIAGNIIAGSGTTAIVLRSLFYYLLKNPATLQNLISEFAAARRAGLLSNFPTWKETQDLRYLNACVIEAQRIHAPID